MLTHPHNSDGPHVPQRLKKISAATNFIFNSLGKNIHMAAPLGLGKPNQLLNEIYERAKKDPSINLKLFTALSLALPTLHSDLEKRFLGPFIKRHFGENYPELEYVKDRLHGKQPPNVEINEFYMQAGQGLHVPKVQQQYVSLNYTHVARSLLPQNLNLLVQIIAKHPTEDRFSLSCNPDVTLDLIELYKNHHKKILVVGVVHPELPFMGGDAEVGADFFDAIVESPEVTHTLFSLPRTPLSVTDHMIGLYASQIIEDDGTLQIGIGSLSDAIISATRLRHKNNEHYRQTIKKLWQDRTKPEGLDLHADVFVKGLYGTSEMIMDAFMELRKEGILKREIFDLDEKKKRYLHGAFFLGSKAFYKWLRELSEVDRAGFSMTRVSKVNDLYDAHELAIRRQRKKARFFNICMNVTLLGGAASETLEDGQVVSGVGGQYNFVAMAHELEDAYSVLMLKSVHESNGLRRSNIVWSQGHLTIPRHLRDVVVTEYGIALLRGKTDEEVIKALINIADSQFQEELAAIAKKNGKLSANYQIPAEARSNTPAKLREFLHSFPSADFMDFPFGSDFTPAEERLAVALNYLQASEKSPRRLLQIFRKGLGMKSDFFTEELDRLQLRQIRSLSDWVYQKLVRGSLRLTSRSEKLQN